MRQICVAQSVLSFKNIGNCLKHNVPEYFCSIARFRFMESEVELNSIINEMHVIATVPDLYNIVVDLNAVQSLLQLLGHENTGQ